MDYLNLAVLWVVVGLILASSCVDFGCELFNYYVPLRVKLTLIVLLGLFGPLLFALVALLWFLCYVTDR